MIIPIDCWKKYSIIDDKTTYWVKQLNTVILPSIKSDVGGIAVKILFDMRQVLESLTREVLREEPMHEISNV